MTDNQGCGYEGCCGRRGGNARLIDARMPELARCLTLFQHVHAITGGPTAHIDQAGAYAVPTLRGEAFAIRPGSITLRVDPAGIAAALIARDEDAVALRLLDRAGRTVHQGQLLSEGDRLLAGLAPTVQAGAGVGGPPSTPSEAPAAWEHGDQLAQLDAVLADGGMARRSAFDRYRGGAHRPIAVDVVASVLDHVRSVGLPIGVAVFAPSAMVMQACAGRVHVTDQTVGGRVFAAVADSSLELDLPSVRACHLVRSTAAHGPTSTLELDDENGRCVAMITQFGMVGEDVHAAWEHLAESLPDA